MSTTPSQSPGPPGTMVPAARSARPIDPGVTIGHVHLRTEDIDRPLRPEHLADDVAALIDQLGAAPADVLGYSLGAEAAPRLAIQHPALVRRLVLVGTPCRRGGNFPEVIAASCGVTLSRIVCAVSRESLSFG